MKKFAIALFVMFVALTTVAHAQWRPFGGRFRVFQQQDTVQADNAVYVEVQTEGRLQPQMPKPKKPTDPPVPPVAPNGGGCSGSQGGCSGSQGGGCSGSSGGRQGLFSRFRNR